MSSTNEKNSIPDVDGPRTGAAVTVGVGVTRTVAELQEADATTPTEEIREQIRPGRAAPDKAVNPDAPATDRFPVSRD